MNETQPSEVIGFINRKVLGLPPATEEEIREARGRGYYGILEGLTLAEWDKYRGNNHQRITTTVRYGGGLRYSDHIGYPLTQALWEDLVHRMCIKDLRIYGPNSEQWTDGRGPGACDIHLDEKGIVVDIWICSN